jgi:hypothetical protein
VPAKKKVAIPPKKEEKSKKPTPKKIVKKEEDSIDAILKNLEKASEGESEKAKNKAKTNNPEAKAKARGASYNEDSPLSITEKQLVKQQVEKHWRPPVGTANFEKVRVSMKLYLEKDGSISKVVVANVICPPDSKSTCTLVEESAIRAVWKANPIENLPADRYNIWKEFDLFFDPSNIM